jgi:hypothetical protein
MLRNGDLTNPCHIREKEELEVVPCLTLGRVALPDLVAAESLLEEEGARK